MHKSIWGFPAPWVSEKLPGMTQVLEDQESSNCGGEGEGDADADAYGDGEGSHGNSSAI